VRGALKRRWRRRTRSRLHPHRGASEGWNHPGDRPAAALPETRDARRWPHDMSSPDSTIATSCSRATRRTGRVRAGHRHGV